MTLTHPEVVHGGDGPLEALADLHVDVLVEARPHGAEGRQRGPVILTSFRPNPLQSPKPLILCFTFFESGLTGSRSEALRLQLPLSPLQLLGFLLQLLLPPQEVGGRGVHCRLEQKHSRRFHDTAEI